MADGDGRFRVLRMPTAEERERPAPSVNVVATLKELLAAAELGGVRAIAVAGVDDEGNAFHNTAIDGEHALMLVGAIHVLQTSFTLDVISDCEHPAPPSNQDPEE